MRRAWTWITRAGIAIYVLIVGLFGGGAKVIVDRREMYGGDPRNDPYSPDFDPDHRPDPRRRPRSLRRGACRGRGSGAW